MRLQLEFLLQSSEGVAGSDGLTSRRADSFGSCPCGALRGTAYCGDDMAAAFPPQLSDPREEREEEATVPFMSWSGKPFMVPSTAFCSFMKYSLHSREGD